MKQKKWYKLDNSGKIFPPITNEYDTSVFRISCTLNETIKEDILQKALDKTLIDFPVFNSVLRRGFFWYYIEQVETTKKVKEESNPICDSIYGILYRVSYYKNRINLEVHHALTDGYGATTFIRCLVANYLNIEHGIKSKEEIDISSTFEKSEDAFKKYYKKFKKHKSNVFNKAYKIKGQEYDDYKVLFIETTCKSSQLIPLVKKHNCSVTEFMVSVLINSIIKKMSEKEKEKPIFITVPVSLRNTFPTYTTRNFFCTMEIAYKSDGTDSLDSIINKVKEQFERELTKENLYSKMSEMIFLESFFICRIVPRRIKDIVLRTSYNITRRAHTMTASNLGRIDMPTEYKKYIKEFCFHSSTDGMQLNIISYEDSFKMCFCSHFVNTEIQMNFVRELTNFGIDIAVDTNFGDNV